MWHVKHAQRIFCFLFSDSCWVCVKGIRGAASLCTVFADVHKKTGGGSLGRTPSYLSNLSNFTYCNLSDFPSNQTHQGMPQFQIFTLKSCFLIWRRASENFDCYPKISNKKLCLTILVPVWFCLMLKIKRNKKNIFPFSESKTILPILRP